MFLKAPLILSCADIWISNSQCFQAPTKCPTLFLMLGFTKLYTIVVADLGMSLGLYWVLQIIKGPE